MVGLPDALAFDALGNLTGYHKHRVRMVTPAGTISSVTRKYPIRGTAQVVPNATMPKPSGGADLA